MTGVVVLIHGLFGDLESWGQTKEFLQDTLGRGYDVVEYKYESTVWGPNPSIPQIAGQLELWLNTTHPNVDLFLVGHSMGGLVAKEYILSFLVRARTKDLRVKALVLAAVPNFGAEAAEIAARFPIVGGIQIKELRPPPWSLIGRFFGRRYSPTFVEDQQKRWFGRVNSKDRHYGSAGKADIDVLVFYAIGDELVSEFSAQGLHPKAYGINGTHKSIVKPKCKDDLIVQNTGRLIHGLPEDEPFTPATSLPTRRIHYVDPMTTFSGYFARFELRLRQAAYPAEFYVLHHIPAGDEPDNTFDMLGRLLANTPTNEPIVVIPRRFEKIETKVKELISNHNDRHIIFVDQEPPPSILGLSNVSYVGPDNWLVGSLAALALAEYCELANIDNATVLSVKGPGGPRRCEGFVNTATQNFLGLNNIEPVQIPDQDRFETAKWVRDLVRERPCVAGFFSGNDETAAAFVEAIEERGHSGVIVGCDGTREMRQLALREGTVLVDTVLTDPDGQAREIVRLCVEHQVGLQHYRRPSLERYIYKADQMIEQNPKLRGWWPDTPTDWHNRASGPTST